MKGSVVMEDKDMLEISFESCDLSKTVTIKEYLCELLLALWSEGESFSGKRPFGNSGWEYDLYVPLVRCGAIEGLIDEDGYVERVDEKMAHKKVSELINLCFK
jgi:hypothetical protein